MRVDSNESEGEGLDLLERHRQRHFARGARSCRKRGGYFRRAAVGSRARDPVLRMLHPARFGAGGSWPELRHPAGANIHPQFLCPMSLTHRGNASFRLSGPPCSPFSSLSRSYTSCAAFETDEHIRRCSACRRACIVCGGEGLFVRRRIGSMLLAGCSGGCSRGLGSTQVKVRLLSIFRWLLLTIVLGVA